MLINHITNNINGGTMKNLFLLCVILLISTFPSIAQDTIRVPLNYPIIQAGIDAASNGDIVLVAEGTYYENIRFRGKAITVASLFLIEDSTKYITNTIINGSQPNNPDSGSVVYFISGEDTNSVLCGFTITGGTGTIWGSNSRSGGGIACRNSDAKIIHNVIENNHVVSGTPATPGGGISGGPQNDNSWIIIENNIIRNNSVTNTALSGEAIGGGISLTQNARIINNIIEFNTAQSTDGAAIGGGAAFICYQLRERYIIGNKIRHNKALVPTGTYIEGGEGGGLFVGDMPKAEIRSNDIQYNEAESNNGLNVPSWGGGVVLVNQTNSTIFSQNHISFNKAINNSPCYGAGLVIWNFDISGGPQIINNIIINNTGGTCGGGLFAGGYAFSTPILINNTICNNSATEGGSIYIGYDVSDTSRPIIINSILWDNSSSIFVNTNSSVDVVYSDVEGDSVYPGEGNIEVYPEFVDTANGDYHLSDISLCIGTGIDSIEIGGIWFYAPLNDVEGNPRPDPTGSMPDIGAYESPLDSPVYVEKYETLIPVGYALQQNYPNPFNPLTRIQYAISSRQFVKLTIYDVLGEEIATLVNEEKPVGRYEVEFDASTLPSGVYFYQLKAGKFIQTKKMILLK
jgi:hypothetical protein